jgi:hypothetical protein
MGETMRMVVRMATALIVNPDESPTKNDSDKLLMATIGAVHNPLSQLFFRGIPDSYDFDAELEGLSRHLVVEINRYGISFYGDNGELYRALVTLRT